MCFSRRKREPTPTQNPWNWQESPLTLLPDFISPELLLLGKVKKVSLEDVDDVVEHIEGVPVQEEEEEEEENVPLSLLNISLNISCNSSKVSSP